ncbi:MAG TPA: DNA topoisomerase, partial [Chloroflexota bacterium]|nr:DNA topoisomerase [Chloroflexota bacterium]
LPNDEHRLYTLIWQRTLASQMPPAKYHQTTALVDGLFADGATKTTFRLRATASELIFPGWLKVYGEDTTPQDTASDAPNDTLPPLTKDQVVYAEEVLPAQHFTQPPRRYTEPTLVKALEDAGVGRPSTYAAVVSTIQDRGYVLLEKRSFVPTELGFAANDFLVSHFPKIVDLPFTAEMEDALDEIAGGRQQWTEMLERFYGPFRETVDRAAGAHVVRPKPSTAPPSASRPSRPLPEAGPCPQCGKPLVERRSQYGAFLGCSGYPTCRYIHRDPTAAKQPFKRTRTRRAASSGPPSPRTKHVVRGRGAKTTRARKKAT